MPNPRWKEGGEDSDSETSFSSFMVHQSSPQTSARLALVEEQENAAAGAAAGAAVWDTKEAPEPPHAPETPLETMPDSAENANSSDNAVANEGEVNEMESFPVEGQGVAAQNMAAPPRPPARPVFQQQPRHVEETRDRDAYLVTDPSALKTPQSQASGLRRTSRSSPNNNGNNSWVMPTMVVLALLAAGGIVGVILAILITSEDNNSTGNSGGQKFAPTQGTTNIVCTSNLNCSEALMDGSRCLENKCTNPFYEQGCFATFLPNWQNGKMRPRVCHSEDSDQARQAGYCRDPDEGLEYTEVRVLAQDWESPTIVAWMWQIILGEVLGVPVTIETGKRDVSLDFYHPSLAFEFGTSNNLTALENSVEIGGEKGCAPVAALNKATNTDDGYLPCAHAIPEVWPTHQLRLAELRRRKPLVAEAPTGLGVIGQQNWFIPLWTAKRNSSLAHYLGLEGDHNRATLADVFKRPTTWYEYCTEVSNSSCDKPDEFATRYPYGDGEPDMYYAGSELYKGYFRKTEENDCENSPDKCTGHFADYPCGWSSYAEQTAYHLDIALRSSGPEPGSRGYPYTRLVEIIEAANATKSDIIFYWWSPEALYSTFARTDFEFQPVGMPPPTQECVDAAVTSEQRCSEDDAVRRGSDKGTCVEPPSTLQKFVAQSLYRISQDPAIPATQRSPAYDLIKDFTITSLELGEIFDDWLARNSDKGFDLRHATCKWLTDNWNDIESAFVPRDFPRVSQDEDDHLSDTFSLVVLILAVVSMLIVFLAAVVTFIQRDRPILQHAQVGFLFILLLGLFSVTVGNVLSALSPTNASCGATIWLINLGYTLELVPLIVKVAAILTLFSAAQKMKRIVLNMRDLYAMVLVISLVVVIYLIVWSVVDIPVKDTYYTLSSDVAEDGSTIITQEHFCRSESNIWRYFAAVWFFVLLLVASILALQTRKIKTDYNETETLAVLIYSHSVFVVLRILTYTLDGEDEDDATRYRSLIFSFDVLAAVVVYFVTKFVSSDHREEDSNDGDATGGVQTLDSPDVYNEGPREVSSGGQEEYSRAEAEQTTAGGNSTLNSRLSSTADRVRRCEQDLDLEPEGHTSIIERVATLEVHIFDQVQQGSLRNRLENLEGELF